MSPKTFDAAQLAQFTGSERMYRHALVRKIIYTEGARYVAESAGAHWLLDEIATAQLLPRVYLEDFQHWRLQVDLALQRAVLQMDDGDGNVRLSKAIAFTDFPAAEIRFYFTNDTILLPSEY